jgi:thiosulfate dehydrogenase [quinone] large subunit
MSDENKLTGADLSKKQAGILVILRVVIGWHFLYEGLIKVFNPNWSSIGFLLDSKGIFGDIFHSIAADPGIVKVVDFLNIWGLTMVGLGLITGFLVRISTIGGMVLLLFYYISHPPFIGAEYAIPSEGNYLIVNKNLIEFLAMWALYLFGAGKYYSIDSLIFRKRE